MGARRQRRAAASRRHRFGGRATACIRCSAASPISRSTTARRVAREGGDRPVFIVPLVWKLRYVALTSAPRCIATCAASSARSAFRAASSLTVATRFHRAAGEHPRAAVPNDSAIAAVAARDDGLLRSAARVPSLARRRSRDALLRSSRATSIDRRIHRLDRAIHAERSRLRAGARDPDSSTLAAQVRDDQARVDEAHPTRRILARDRTPRATLSQEQIAESLKRLRAALVRRGTVNTLHNYLPRPYGARVAHVRVPEPIRDRPAACLGRTTRGAYAAELLEQNASRHAGRARRRSTPSMPPRSRR